MLLCNLGVLFYNDKLQQRPQTSILTIFFLKFEWPVCHKNIHCNWKKNYTIFPETLNFPIIFFSVTFFLQFCFCNFCSHCIWTKILTKNETKGIISEVFTYSMFYFTVYINSISFINFIVVVIILIFIHYGQTPPGLHSALAWQETLGQAALENSMCSCHEFNVEWLPPLLGVGFRLPK